MVLILRKKRIFLTHCTDAVAYFLHSSLPNLIGGNGNNNSDSGCSVGLGVIGLHDETLHFGLTP
jgi:hypothetical protein